MEDPRAAQPPLPTPLPTVEIPGGKTVVQPRLDGARASPGSWSPDGAYFVFGLQNEDLTLHFLNARSGDVCPTEGEVAFAPTLRQRHTWLPDGRLLYLDAGGELVEMANQDLVPQMIDDYALVRVASPDAAPQRLAFDGHTPREYPHLSLKYLAQTDQIAVASAHGVSLVSLVNGERETYYDLPGPGFGPWLILSPDGATVIATKDQGALYGPLP